MLEALVSLSSRFSINLVSNSLCRVEQLLKRTNCIGTIALGIMVVADLAPPHSRGRYVGAMLSGCVPIDTLFPRLDYGADIDDISVPTLDQA